MEKSQEPLLTRVPQTDRLRGMTAGSTDGSERETDRVPRFDTEEAFHNDFDSGKTGARQSNWGDEFGMTDRHRRHGAPQDRSPAEGSVADTSLTKGKSERIDKDHEGRSLGKPSSAHP